MPDIFRKRTRWLTKHCEGEKEATALYDLSIYLFLFVYHFLYSSIFLFIFLSLYFFICLSIYLSVDISKSLTYHNYTACCVKKTLQRTKTIDSGAAQRVAVSWAAAALDHSFRRSAEKIANSGFLATKTRHIWPNFSVASDLNHKSSNRQAARC